MSVSSSTLALPPSSVFPGGWAGDLAAARRLQVMLAGRVVLTGPPVDPPRLVAGVDAGLEDQGTVMHAAAVLLDGQSLQPIAQAVARLPVVMPYIPGMLSFRELPAVLAALAQLPDVPDLVMCDGHGIAHPRRLGIAAHLGVWSGLATLGVAKKRLCGSHDEPGPLRGDRAELRDRGEWIGTVLRTRDRVAPVIVSPGHRVSLDRAPELVLAMTTRFRLPEPTRLADRLASQRELRRDQRKRL
jgi:deoxyribonuclease V